MKLEWPNVNEKSILAEIIPDRFSWNTSIYKKEIYKMKISWSQQKNVQHGPGGYWATGEILDFWTWIYEVIMWRIDYFTGKFLTWPPSARSINLSHSVACIRWE